MDAMKRTHKIFHHDGGDYDAMILAEGWWYLEVFDGEVSGPFGPYEDEDQARARIAEIETWVEKELGECGP
jgi:hypothetical protein